MRVNGKDLVLAETCMWFDSLSKEDSLKFKKIYVDGNVEVPLSEVKCVQSSEFIPEFLVLGDGEIMKKRKERKILAYPSKHKTLYDAMYTRLLLFYPFQSEEELLLSDLADIYRKTNSENEVLVDIYER